MWERSVLYTRSSMFRSNSCIWLNSFMTYALFSQRSCEIYCLCSNAWSIKTANKLLNENIDKMLQNVYNKWFAKKWTTFQRQTINFQFYSKYLALMKDSNLYFFFLFLKIWSRIVFHWPWNYLMLSKVQNINDFLYQTSCSA